MRGHPFRENFAPRRRWIEDRRLAASDWTSRATIRVRCAGKRSLAADGFLPGAALCGPSHCSCGQRFASAQGWDSGSILLVTVLLLWQAMQGMARSLRTRGAHQSVLGLQLFLAVIRRPGESPRRRSSRSWAPHETRPVARSCDCISELLTIRSGRDCGSPS